MFMICNTFRAQRGKAPVLIDLFKAINQALMTHENFSNGKIYADMTGPMDTITWQLEAVSLDQFYQVERGLFDNPDADTQRMIDMLNSGAIEGKREIFEVIL